MAKREAFKIYLKKDLKKNMNGDTEISGLK